MRTPDNICTMKNWILTLALTGFCLGIQAQYTLYKEVKGVQFYTKWSHEKWWSKKSPRVLLVKVVNTNDSAASFQFGLELTKNLQLVEQSNPMEYCVVPKGKSMPRVRGTVFKPTASPADYDSWELSDLEVELIGDCENQ